MVPSLPLKPVKYSLPREFEDENEAIMVNVMCQLYWVKGCPDCWDTLFLGVSCEGVSGRDWNLMTKERRPGLDQCGQASSIPLTASI